MLQQFSSLDDPGEQIDDQQLPTTQAHSSQEDKPKRNSDLVNEVSAYPGEMEAEEDGTNRVGIDIILQRRGHFDEKREEEAKSESEESSMIGLAPRDCYSERQEPQQMSSSESEQDENRNADL